MDYDYNNSQRNKNNLIDAGILLGGGLAGAGVGYSGLGLKASELIKRIDLKIELKKQRSDFNEGLFNALMKSQKKYLKTHPELLKQIKTKNAYTGTLLRLTLGTGAAIACNLKQKHKDIQS